MKDYNQVYKKVLSPQLSSVLCNKCGKEHKVEDEEYDLNLNLYHTFSASFGYGSEFDFESWHFDLCEECLIKFVDTFKIKPDGKDID